MNLSNQDVQLAQGMWVSSATQQHPLGTRGYTNDGRAYRYALAGAVDLAAGKVVQSAAVVAGHQSLTVNTTGALATFSTSITVTCASSVGVNFFAEGYACIASSGGQGYLYTINSHPAITAGANGIFTFYAPEEVTQVAVVGSTIVTLYPNKYRGCVVVPATTATGLVVGVAPYIITAAQYGWLQTWGPCAVLTNDASAIGQMMNGIAASCGAVAGLSSPAVTACYQVGQFTGVLAQTGVAGQYCVIDLRLAV